jgi:16S rRNA (cytosine1402-N4)-methyltransferase
MSHISVLLKEVVSGLDLQKGEIFVDGTIGSAGHSLEVCQRLNKDVRIIGIDQDEDRVKDSREKLEKVGCDSEIVQGNFRDIDKILDKLNVKKVNKIFLDLGLNSEQLENSNRGFSFQKDEPLIMSMSPDPLFTAKEIVNDWAEESIADIIFAYGEEKFSRQIAEKIVILRKESEIKTTKDLVGIIDKAVPNWYKHKKIHFATRTFQALRIAVNDELKALKEALMKSFEKLEVGGRIVVISFHSLEDRIVKDYFRELKNKKLGRVLTKKPITPERVEIKKNPRSRSAKLRIIEKI